MGTQIGAGLISLLLIFCTAAIRVRGNQDNLPDAPVKLTNEEIIESLKKQVSALIDKTDEFSKDKLYNLRTLIDVAESKWTDCRSLTFARLTAWIEDVPNSILFETNKEDIVNLLRHNRQELWKKCEPLLLNRLTVSVGKMTPKQRKFAEDMIREIVKANNGDLDFSYSAAATGIANYLKNANALNRTKNVRIQSMAWRRHIIEACIPIRDGINSDTYIYRSIETQEKLGQFERKWLLASRVCERLNGLQANVYKQL